MKAIQKNRLLQAQFQNRGINIQLSDVDTLRVAQMTLRGWFEGECGACNNYASWCIVRDEETGKPFREVHPNSGKSYREPIRDRETGALRRVKSVCEANGLYYYIQGDPRGCALYVDQEPVPDNNYTRAIACVV